jgi:hypothetical protein
MNRAALRLLLVLTAVVALVVTSATAYVLSGDSWPHPAGGPMPMTETWALCANTVDVNGLSAAGAVLTAAQTWNAAGARFRFNFGAFQCQSSTPRLDGVNQVTWGEFHQYPAATYVWASSTTHQIYEVDTIIGDFYYKWSVVLPTPSDSLDIQTVMLHEFGHWLDLDHSSPPAVMQPFIDYGEARRTLTQDDIDGAIAIYGCG